MRNTSCCPLPGGLLRPGWALLLVVLLAATVGCQQLSSGLYDPSVGPPVPPPQLGGTEMARVSLPAYRIEPPDLISLEMLKQVPKPPYRLEIFDVLQAQVVGTLLDQPIDGFYLIEGEGTVNLGPAYGTVRIAGMTINEASAAITAHLRQILSNPVVSLQLARTAGTQPITGTYLVAPDGTINLRQYGVVYVAGMTIAEARMAVERHLQQFFDSPEVSLDIAGYNSKGYYIITEGAELGDNVVRLPVTGNETVLDAIAQIGGLSQLSSTDIWIARPAPTQFGCEQILPVDWQAITRGGATSTNYQILPGDRVYIAQDQVIAVNNFIAKITAPIERLLGTTSLTASTARNVQTLGRAYNATRR